MQKLMCQTEITNVALHLRWSINEALAPRATAGRPCLADELPHSAIASSKNVAGAYTSFLQVPALIMQS